MPKRDIPEPHEMRYVACRVRGKGLWPFMTFNSRRSPRGRKPDVISFALPPNNSLHSHSSWITISDILLQAEPPCLSDRPPMLGSW
jgi:hypothetical protein